MISERKKTCDLSNISSNIPCLCEHCIHIRAQQVESEKIWIKKHLDFDR